MRVNWPEHHDGDWLVIEILPGFLEAHAGRNFGKPTIVGHRLYAELGLAQSVYEDEEDHPGPSKEQRLALYAFSLGVAWQRSRKLRERMEQAVAAGWNKRRELRNKAEGG